MNDADARRSHVSGSQTIGPFFRFALERPEWADLTAQGAQGEKIVITGRVIDGDGVPVTDALLEIWQANAVGKYPHPEDDQDKPVDPNFRGFGRACTDTEGVYLFRTIVPGEVPGNDGTMQAPHIDVTIFARGLLKRLVTRMYLSDRADANTRDPFLMTIADATVRETLVAQRQPSTNGDVPTYRFDIVLQGERETAFLDI